MSVLPPKMEFEGRTRSSSFLQPRWITEIREALDALGFRPRTFGAKGLILMDFAQNTRKMGISALGYRGVVVQLSYFKARRRLCIVTQVYPRTVNDDSAMDLERIARGVENGTFQAIWVGALQIPRDYRSIGPNFAKAFLELLVDSSHD